jgi:hypothetical protein
MEGSNAPKAAANSKVYAGETKDWVENALKAGLPVGHIEYILVFAALTEKNPREVQNKWMDAHVGVQQIFREL